MYEISQLSDMLVPELREIADRLGIKGYRKLNKQDLIYQILDQQALAVNEDEPELDTVAEMEQEEEEEDFVIPTHIPAVLPGGEDDDVYLRRSRSYTRELEERLSVERATRPGSIKR